jgi:NAD(P) transhydrogenase subunit alpha
LAKKRALCKVRRTARFPRLKPTRCSMKIAILKERRPHETRVAATPETVKKLKALGAAEIVIETGAGVAAAYTDQAYSDAGATIVPDAAAAVSAADIVFKIQRPMGAGEGVDELALLRQGQVLMSPLGALFNKDLVQALADKGVTAFALELIPRITRAQSMDILSSQANLAGYKAVLVAANRYGRILPQMMTPGGTLAPSRAFIMGVGVAGLQAIATARRLGSIVTATDVRPATKEQVQSLGAKFIAVEDEEFKAAETSGGYAKEMSAEYRAKQAALVAEHIKTQDIVITTALIPGRKAPVLVSEDMVKTMKPGSVIVDMAVEQGGNCPLSQFGQTVEVYGVKIVGPANLPGELATDSSSLFARNLLNFITPMVDKETKALKIDTNDEVVKGTLVTQNGQVVHPSLAQPS